MTIFIDAHLLDDNKFHALWELMQLMVNRNKY